MDAPPHDRLAEYRALRDKIDAFADGVGTRRAADLSCRAGCAACCHVPAPLEVSAVESASIARHLAELPAAERAALRRRAALARDAQDAAQDAPAEAAPSPCVMLRDDDTCAIYAARPLVCRTQGLPLRYPEDTIPIAAIMARLPAARGALTWCPLNFTAQPPGAADALDAERADALLALVNQRYVNEDPGSARLSPEERRQAAVARHSLSALAAGR